MEKDLVDIVMEKSYIELTPDERSELSEFCNSESEFNQMKEVFQGVEMMQFETPTPRKETKESLDSLFDQTHPKVAPIWYMSVLGAVVPKEKPVHRQPLLQIAAVGLLLLLVYPFMNPSVEESAPQLAQAEVVQKETGDVQTNTKAAEPVKIEQEPEPADIVLAEVVEPKSIVTKDPIGGSMAASSGASVDPKHPDGVFEGAEIAFSQPASAEPEMMDLLTATF